MKHITIILLLGFLLFKTTSCKAQNNNTEAALYNIGLGSVFGGIGAVINKKPNEKFGKTFLKGFTKGAAGGYLIYESKNILKRISTKEKWEYAWGAKIVNSFGVSVVENAALNKGALEQLNLNIGFNRIEFHTNEKLKIKYKVLPASFLVMAGTAFYSKFQFKRSLQTGEIIFSTNDNKLPNALAITLGNIVRFRDSNIDNYKITTHEFVHIYQYYDYNFINSYTNKTLSIWTTKNKRFKKLNKYLYWDIQGTIYVGLYYLGDGLGNNFFEHEAEYYSKTLHGFQ